MFKTEQIAGINLAQYEKYISDSYRAQIRRGELNAVAVFDDYGGEDRFYGLYVTGRHNGWLEIVQISFADEDKGMMARADFIRYCIRSERIINDGSLKGAFMEVHMDEGGEEQEILFLLAGMESKREKNNIYEFTLSQVGQRAMLSKLKKRLECRSISECEEDELDEMDAIIQEDERNTPVPLFMDWYEYDQDLSKICFNNGKPVGALLFTNYEDHLVIELAYTADNMALPVMLANALDDAEKIYSPDKKVLVPVVVNKTKEIIEKMVPGAYRGEIVEGVVWF